MSNTLSHTNQRPNPCFRAKIEIRKCLKPLSDRLDDLPNPDMKFASVVDVRKVISNFAKDVFCCPCDVCRINSGRTVLWRTNEFERSSQLEQQLCGEYAATFALLIHIGFSGAIQRFIAHSLALKDQEFVANSLRRALNETSFSADEKDYWIAEIEENQYMFFAQKWSACDIMKGISAKEALPLVDEKPTTPQQPPQGSFGVVRKCKIMPGYTPSDQNVQKNPVFFARKVFKPHCKKPGKDEWTVIASMKNQRKLPHDHLVEAFGAYQYGDNIEATSSMFFIMFPWADTTLHAFLFAPEPPFKIPIKDLWQQMEGITDGLSVLHDQIKSKHRTTLDVSQLTKENYFHLFHLDLKPANILIFFENARFIFKITDFGLAHVRDRDILGGSSASTMGSTMTYSKIPRGDNDYSPPDRQETKTNLENVLAGHDCWSLGAILSEVAVYDALGQAGGDNYRVARHNEHATKCNGGANYFHDQRQMLDTVSAYHYRINEDAKTGKLSPSQTDEDNAWRNIFYSYDELFTGINELMNAAPGERKRASEMKKLIKDLIERASEDFKLKQAGTWSEIPDFHTDGGVGWPDDEEPTEQINAWLYSPKDENPVKVTIGFFEDDKFKFRVARCVSKRIRDIDRDKVMGVLPRRLQRNGKYALDLYLDAQSAAGRIQTYSFDSPEDAFTVQRRITGQDIIDSRTFRLEKVIFHHWGREKKIEPESGLLLLQLWAFDSNWGYPKHIPNHNTVTRLVIWQESKPRNDGICYSVKISAQYSMNTGDTDTIHIESPKLIGPAVNYQPVKLVYGHGLPCVTNKLGSDDYKKCKKISLHFHENEAKDFETCFGQLTDIWKNFLKSNEPKRSCYSGNDEEAELAEASLYRTPASVP